LCGMMRVGRGSRKGIDICDEKQRICALCKVGGCGRRTKRLCLNVCLWCAGAITKNSGDNKAEKLTSINNSIVRHVLFMVGHESFSFPRLLSPGTDTFRHAKAALEEGSLLFELVSSHQP
jgi:hypothetical protein